MKAIRAIIDKPVPKKTLNNYNEGDERVQRRSSFFIVQKLPTENVQFVKLQPNIFSQQNLYLRNICEK